MPKLAHVFAAGCLALSKRTLNLRVPVSLQAPILFFLSLFPRSFNELFRATIFVHASVNSDDAPFIFKYLTFNLILGDNLFSKSGRKSIFKFDFRKLFFEKNKFFLRSDFFKNPFDTGHLAL